MLVYSYLVSLTVIILSSGRTIITNGPDSNGISKMPVVIWHHVISIFYLHAHPILHNSYHPHVLFTCRRGLAVAALGNALYAIGGLDDSTCFDSVERYDPSIDSWSAVAPMNIPRGGVGIGVLKVKLSMHLTRISIVQVH